MTQAMEFSTPDIAASLALGLVGFGVFRYGKKASRTPHFVAGIALMGAPYLVTGAAAMLTVGGVIAASLWISVRAGL